MITRVFTLLLLCLLLQACAGQPGATGESERFVAAQKAQAQQLEKQGRLAEALALWRTVLPLGKTDGQARQAIRSLQNRITANVTSLRQKANAAYAQNNRRLGDNYMLKLLALKPGDTKALSELEQSTSARAQAKSRNKAEPVYALAPAAQAKSDEPAPPAASPALLQKLETLFSQQKYRSMLTLGAGSSDSNPQVARLMRRAHLGLAEIERKNGKPELALQHSRKALKQYRLASDPLPAKIAKLERELSDSWYQLGRKAMSSDLDGAIEALGKAVAYNKNNIAATKTLEKAETLKRNLEKIEGNR